MTLRKTLLSRTIRDVNLGKRLNLLNKKFLEFSYAFDILKMKNSLKFWTTRKQERTSWFTTLKVNITIRKPPCNAKLFLGCAQKELLAMLEEVASHAIVNQHNPRGLRRLLTKLRQLYAAKRSACWGGPLGSQMLWHQHTMKIERILSAASKMQVGATSLSFHFLLFPYWKR